MAHVYTGKVWGAARAEFRPTAQKGTAEWVSRVGGAIILGTVEDVADMLLDNQGRYWPLDHDVYSKFREANQGPGRARRQRPVQEPTRAEPPNRGAR